jgi:hypothetical protein
MAARIADRSDPKTGRSTPSEPFFTATKDNRSQERPDTEHSGDGCEKTIARYLFDLDYGWDFVRRYHPEDDSACRTANVANPDVRSSGTLQIAKDLDGAPHL